MKGKELKTIRHDLELSTYEMGRAIGYRGNRNTISVQMRQMETDAKPIVPWIARLVLMFKKFGVPADWY